MVSFENYKILEPKDYGNYHIALLHYLAKAVQNSFYNGYARQYLEAFFCCMKIRDRYFIQSQRKSEADYFFLKVEQKKYAQNPKPVPSSIETGSDKLSREEEMENEEESDSDVESNPYVEDSE